MGLRGPLSKPPRLRALAGNPGRRKSTSRDVPSVLRKQVDRIADLMEFGDYYRDVAKEFMAKGEKTPRPALWATLKCWRQAQDAAYRTAGFEDEPVHSDPIQAFKKARPPRPA